MTVAWMGVLITARTWSDQETQLQTLAIPLPFTRDPRPATVLGDGRGDFNQPVDLAMAGGETAGLAARLNHEARTEAIIAPTGGGWAPTPQQTAVKFVVNGTCDLSDANLNDGLCGTGFVTPPCESAPPPPNPGPCTLRAAIEQANALGQPVDIFFARALQGGTITLDAALDPLVITNPNTKIDALALVVPDEPVRPFPPAFVTLSGANGGGPDGLTIQADNCTIRGLAINGFGGHGINIIDGMNNMVKSNMIGTDRFGNTAVPNNKAGVFIGTSAVKATIGGTTEAERHVISGNRQQGILVFNQAPREHKIQGNYIGTDATGQARIGGVTMGQNQSSGGIQIDDPESNTIGAEEEGVTVGEPPGNVIAYNDGPGLRVSRSSNNKVIGNRINNNARDGVLIDLGGTTNKISQNSIFANGGTGTRNLGIDLVGSEPYSRDSVDTNDTGDGDTGPNNQQNFPEIGPVTTSGGTTTIQGTLRSTPNTTFTLEFFTNSVQDSTNPCCFGEREKFLSFPVPTTVTTNSTGNVSFTFSTQTSIPTGHRFMTATAIDPDGNTSEFAQNVPISGSGTIPPFITVLVPDGGEDWAIGSVQPIQWDPDGVTGDVKIELSRDGGSTFEILFANTANDGSENWTVTGPTSSNCLVKISSVDDPSINDLSNATFTLSQSPPGPSITVLVPDGGESWPIGSVQTIQWSSSGITSNVNIELSRDGGFRYTTIIARNTANTGSYQWTVTAPASSQCRVRVISLNPVVLDESDDVFSITP